MKKIKANILSSYFIKESFLNPEFSYNFFKKNEERIINNELFKNNVDINNGILISEKIEMSFEKSKDIFYFKDLSVNENIFLFTREVSYSIENNITQKVIYYVFN